MIRDICAKMPTQNMVGKAICKNAEAEDKITFSNSNTLHDVGTSVQKYAIQ